MYKFINVLKSDYFVDVYVCMCAASAADYYERVWSPVHREMGNSLSVMAHGLTQGTASLHVVLERLLQVGTDSACTLFCAVMQLCKAMVYAGTCLACTALDMFACGHDQSWRCPR